MQKRKSCLVRIEAANSCLGLTGRGSKARQAEHFVFRLDDVLVHSLSRALRVAVLNGFQYFAMFAARGFAVVVNINGGEHDSLHLGAGFVNGLDEHLVPGEAGDRRVKSGIRLDETDTALPVVRTACDRGELGKLAQDLRIAALERRELRRLALNRAAKFVNVVQHLQRNLSDEIAAIRNDAKEAFVLQSDSCFADGGAAALVSVRQVLLVQGFTGLIHAVDDVALQRAIDLLAQGCSRARGSRSEGHQRGGGGKGIPVTSVSRCRLRQKPSNVRGEQIAFFTISDSVSNVYHMHTETISLTCLIGAV
jgi:hypothetical protein